MFHEDDPVRVVSGPFTHFSGVVEEVDEARSRLKVALSVFGHATRVELEYGQGEKAEAFLRARSRYHRYAEGPDREEAEMAREKPLDLAVVQAWLSAWNESDIFSDAAVRHLQCLITDPLCLVVITLGMGHEPRSLVFRRWKHVEFWMPVPGRGVPKFVKQKISELPSMFVSTVAPDSPPIGQLWYQTGVKSETIPKLERVLRWDGADWLVAGYVFDDPTIMVQGKQVCDFMEALASAHASTKWLDCEFIYTYDGSTWGNA
jgi:hypothetical protein